MSSTKNRLLLTVKFRRPYGIFIRRSVHAPLKLLQEKEKKKHPAGRKREVRIETYLSTYDRINSKIVRNSRPLTEFEVAFYTRK